MDYGEFATAVKRLGLGERATLQEIKTRYRTLVKQNHPDTGAVDDPEIIRGVNSAYRIVHDYVAAYRFSFSEGEFYEQNPEERLRQQFMNDPLWGKG